MWWNLATASLRAASHMAWVPSTLVRKNRAGSKIARLLCDSAAKWTIVSVPCSPSVASTRAWSQMSPWTNTTCPELSKLCDAAAVPHVGQSVEHDQAVVGMMLRPVAHEVRTYEPGSAGD